MVQQKDHHKEEEEKISMDKYIKKTRNFIAGFQQKKLINTKSYICLIQKKNFLKGTRKQTILQ